MQGSFLSPQHQEHQGALPSPPLLHRQEIREEEVQKTKKGKLPHPKAEEALCPPYRGRREETDIA